MELITHSGPFQGDDALAYALLKLVYPNHVLVRTRDLEYISRAAQKDPSTRIIFDVGGIYNPSNFQFDHHGDRLENLPHYNSKSAAPMAACGLVFKTFKRQILEQVLLSCLPGEIGSSSSSASALEIDDAFCDLVYKNFIHDFDAIDNGVYNNNNSSDGMSIFLEKIGKSSKPDDDDDDNFQIGLAGNKYNMYAHLATCVNLMNIPNCSDAELNKTRFCTVAVMLETIFCAIVYTLWHRYTFKQTVKRSGSFAVYLDTTSPKCSPYNGIFHVYRDHQSNYCVYTSNKNVKLPDAVPSKEFVFLHQNRFVCKYKNLNDFQSYIQRIVDKHCYSAEERQCIVEFVVSQIQDTTI